MAPLGSSFAVDSPRLRELILDAWLGLGAVPRDDEWSELGYLDPILEAWHAGQGGPIHFYAAGGWGPSAADELLTRDGREWRRP